jgi:hypothetical protein
MVSQRFSWDENSLVGTLNSLGRIVVFYSDTPSAINDSG